MPILLKTIIAIQIVLGIWWVVPLSMGEVTFSTLYVLVLTSIPHAVFFLVACWAVWKHPTERRKAGVIMALPILFFILPGLIKLVAGGPLTGQRGVIVGIVLLSLGLGFCVLFPRKVIRFMPKGIFRSPVFNWLIIIGMVIAWLLPIAAILWLATEGNIEPTGGGQGSPGMAAAYMLVFLAFYIIAVAAGSVFAMVFGWIGLRGGIENPCRGLNIAQIVMGAPSIVLGALTLAWLGSQNL